MSRRNADQHEHVQITFPQKHVVWLEDEPVGLWVTSKGTAYGSPVDRPMSQ